MSLSPTPAPPLPQSADPVLEAVLRGVEVVDLGRQLTIGMPQSPNHPAFWHALPRRHGDMVRPDGGSAANDIITMGTHVGTHVDALSHVSQDGRLHGDLDALEAGIGGRYAALGAHTIEPMVRRGVLLDIPAVLSLPRCAPGQEITADNLDQACAKQGVEVRDGDVVLIRSGWGQHFDSGDRDAYIGHDTGVPGVGAEGAQWLADRNVHAAGADTIAFECLPAGSGHSVLPAHSILLVAHGIYIIEAMALEELAQRATTEFLFLLSPLPIFGATGSPARPLAVISRG